MDLPFLLSAASFAIEFNCVAVGHHSKRVVRNAAQPRGTAELRTMRDVLVATPHNRCLTKSVMSTILLIILILLLVGALPTWSHSKSWGYFPSGGLGLILVILIILILLDKL